MKHEINPHIKPIPTRKKAKGLHSLKAARARVRRRGHYSRMCDKGERP